MENGKLFDTAVRGVLVDLRPYYKAKDKISPKPLNSTRFPLNAVTAKSLLSKIQTRIEKIPVVVDKPLSNKKHSEVQDVAVAAKGSRQGVDVVNGLTSNGANLRRSSKSKGNSPGLSIKKAEQNSDSKSFPIDYTVDWTRQFRSIQSQQELITTYWIMSKGPKKLLLPPPVPSEIELACNDLFIHLWSIDRDPQTWLCTSFSLKSVQWKEVKEGHYIEDEMGTVRVLHFVKSHDVFLRPSWVKEDSKRRYLATLRETK